MKKLFTLLITATLLLSACGGREVQTDYRQYIDEKIYETFVFDETAIVSKKEWQGPSEDNFSVTGGENPQKWYYTEESDSRGRILRRTCYTDSTKTKVHTTTEYSYADHGHYIKFARLSDTCITEYQFSYFSRDGLYEDRYFFTHTYSPEEFYGFNMRIQRQWSADKKTCTDRYYNMDRKEYEKAVVNFNDRGAVEKITTYKDGVLLSVEQYDTQNNTVEITYYKDGKPDYIKTIEQGGVTLTYTDPDGNPINKP